MSSNNRVKPHTKYERYLLQLGESHDLLLMNDLPCLLGSGGLHATPIVMQPVLWTTPFPTRISSHTSDTSLSPPSPLQTMIFSCFPSLHLPSPSPRPNSTPRVKNRKKLKTKKEIVQKIILTFPIHKIYKITIYPSIHLMKFNNIMVMSHKTLKAKTGRLISKSQHNQIYLK
jgi:hypothetical protein